MNLTLRTASRISIALSRRNLETLIKCLDCKVGMPVIHRVVTDEGLFLTIKAEEDEEHYQSAHRNEKARGIMGVGPEDIE